MLFKSEKKVLKNTILEIISEKTPLYVSEVKELKTNEELSESALELEIDSAKKKTS